MLTRLRHKGLRHFLLQNQISATQREFGLQAYNYMEANDIAGMQAHFAKVKPVVDGLRVKVNSLCEHHCSRAQGSSHHLTVLIDMRGAQILDAQIEYAAVYDPAKVGEYEEKKATPLIHDALQVCAVIFSYL